MQKQALYTYGLIALLLSILVGCTVSPERRRPATGEAAHLQTRAAPPQKITLLLPMQGELSQAGQAVRDGFFAAYYEAQQQSTVHPQVHIINTNQPSDITTLYQNAVDEGAEFIVGPLQRNKVERLALQGQITVPTLALNVLPRGLRIPKGFYQFSLAQELEAEQLADTAQRAGYSRALLVTLDNQWGRNIARALTNRWEGMGGSIVDTLFIAPNQDLAPAIKDLVKPARATISSDGEEPRQDHRGRELLQHRSDADVLFLITPPNLARQIRPLLKYYYAGDLPTYATSVVYDVHAGAKHNKDLDGVIVCDMPWVQTEESTQFSSNQYARLYALGIDTYYIATTLPVQTYYWGYQGNTGHLQLNQANQVVRDLTCAPIRQGKPQLGYALHF